ncbi:hypothetical protein, partial [Xanthomonas graminis]|uniref:hypothetical protein n=1 Tax=Xanthomonas graminis TaxID=3390026 RepID=UPI001C8F709F
MRRKKHARLALHHAAERKWSEWGAMTTTPGHGHGHGHGQDHRVDAVRQPLSRWGAPTRLRHKMHGIKGARRNICLKKIPSLVHFSKNYVFLR